MKIEVKIDDGGLTASMSFEFDKKCMDAVVLREKIAEQVVDFLIRSGAIVEDAQQAASDQPKTLMDSLAEFIKYEFRDQWFTSQELKDKYETVRDDIKLSTVSTYLSRMHHDGMLERRGNKNKREYRLVRANTVDSMPCDRRSRSESKL